MIRDGSLADFLDREREENEKKRRRVVKQSGRRGDVDVALWLRLISSKIQGEIENEVVALFGHARKWRKTRTYVSNTESTCRAMSRLIYLRGRVKEMLRRRVCLFTTSSPRMLPTITRSLLALLSLNYFAGFRPGSSLFAETPTRCWPNCHKRLQSHLNNAM